MMLLGLSWSQVRRGKVGLAIDTRQGSNLLASLFTPTSQMGGSQHITMNMFFVSLDLS